MINTYYSRKVSVLALVILYLFVGVPIWYKLTSIFRVKLPTKYIASLNENRFQDVHMVIPIYLKSEIYRFPDIDKAVQTQINYLLDGETLVVPWSLQVLNYDEEAKEQAAQSNKTYHLVELVLDKDVGLLISEKDDRTIVFFNDESVVSNDLPFFIAQTVVEYTFKMEFNNLNKKIFFPTQDYAIAYSPDVHLNFNLLNGDGTPIGWEIDEALKTHFTPMRTFLSPLMNFTVDTNIVYYNDLNVASLNNLSDVTLKNLSHTIDYSSLTNINEPAEQNSLNLAVVFPSKKTVPDGLTYINSNKEEELKKDNSMNKLDANINPSWESFIIPKWGVVIINKYPIEENMVLDMSYLSNVLNLFSNNLLELVGITGGSEDNDEKELKTPYVLLNSYKRMLTLANLDKSIETLFSLSSMLDKFQKLSVPQQVLDDVYKALELRLEIIDLLNNPYLGDDNSWNYALVMSNELITLTERAFFNQEMVQQNHTPQEHKLAIYLPLLGPLTVLVLFSFINSVTENASKLTEVSPRDNDCFEKEDVDVNVITEATINDMEEHSTGIEKNMH